MAEPSDGLQPADLHDVPPGLGTGTRTLSLSRCLSLCLKNGVYPQLLWGIYQPFLRRFFR